MATKKKKKKTWEPTPAAQPQPRSLSDEMGALVPILGQLGSMQTDEYVGAQKELTQYEYDFFRQHYPELAGMEREEQSKSTARVRSDALQWLGQYGGQAQAQYEAANPRLTQQLNKIQELTGQIGQRSELTQTMDQQALAQLRAGGPTTPFTETLDQQALAELKLGGALTPEEERASQQSARAAYAARGQALGNASSVAEVLNRDSMARARLRERQGIAAGRETGALQRLQLGQAYAGQQQAFAQQQETLDRSFLQGNAALMDQISPVWKFLGMSSQATAPSTLMGFTQGVRTPDPSSILGAGLTYGADVYNTNLNMAASQYNAYQNNMAALQGAKIAGEAQIRAAQAQASAYGGGGSGIGGSLIGAGASIIGSVAGGLAAF